MSACCLAYALLMVMTSSVVSESGACHFHAQSLPFAMYAHQGIFGTPQNAVYLFGGYSGTNWGNRVDLSKVYKWDLNDPSSWFVEIGSIPARLVSWIQNAVLVNDLVFFIGVEHANWRNGTMFVFDLNTESFLAEHKTPMPNPLTGGCLTTNTTHIFMVDGWDGTDTQRLPIIQVYDVAADVWQSRVLDAGPSTIGGWYAQYCSLVGNALYVLGGYAASLRDEIYRINTLTLEMEELSATLPAPQVSGASIADGDQHLFLFGAFPFKSDVESLDLETLSVSTAFSSQQSYASAPVLTVNGSIYRFGGRRFETDKFYALDQVEICDLPTDTNPSVSPTTELTTSDPTAAHSSTLSRTTSSPTKPDNSNTVTVPSVVIEATLREAMVEETIETTRQPGHDDDDDAGVSETESHSWRLLIIVACSATVCCCCVAVAILRCVELARQASKRKVRNGAQNRQAVQLHLEFAALPLHAAPNVQALPSESDVESEERKEDIDAAHAFANLVQPVVARGGVNVSILSNRPEGLPRAPIIAQPTAGGLPADVYHVHVNTTSDALELNLEEDEFEVVDDSVDDDAYDDDDEIETIS